MNEAKLLYTKTHEWLAFDTDDTCSIGITRFAVEQLTDIVYVELPEVGRQFNAGDTFGVIESVKAVSDLYAPCPGEVIEINQAIVDNPGLLNEDPYAKGWMIRIRVPGTISISGLMDKAGYEAHLAAEKH
jgi:glycine cleavage system H protein